MRARMKRALSFAAAMALSVSALTAVAPYPVAAAGYDLTNPGANACGNGSHAMPTWQSYYLVEKYNRLRIALVELRRSDYCNTVWTRVTNVTGTKATWFEPVPRTLVVQERIDVFTCADASCRVSTSASTLQTDTIQPVGSSPNAGWSLQITLPAGTTIGGRPQAPAVMAYASTTTVAAEPDGITHGLTSYPPQVPWPVWVQWLPVQDYLKGCTPGSTTYPCISWPVIGGASSDVPVTFDSSLALDAAHGGATVNLATDAENAMTQWRNAPARNPDLRDARAGESGLVVIDRSSGRPGCDFTVGGIACTTVWQMVNAPTVITACQVTFNSAMGFNHTYTWNPAASPPTSDSRTVVTHELGHCEGLGHVGITLRVSLT